MKAYLDEVFLSPLSLMYLAGQAQRQASTMRGVDLTFDIDHYLNRLVPSSRLHLLPKPVSRFLGYRHDPAPPIGNVMVWWWAFIGAFSGLLVVEAVFRSARLQAEGVPLVIASLVRPTLNIPGSSVTVLIRNPGSHGHPRVPHNRFAPLPAA